MTESWRNAAATGQPVVEEKDHVKIWQSLKEWVSDPSWDGFKFGGALGLGLGLIGFGIFVPGWVGLVIPGIGFAVAGLISLTVLDGRLKTYPDPLVYGSKVTTGPAPEPPAPPAAGTFDFSLSNNLPTVELWQPGPGTFARWLTDVLDPDLDITFSLRQGRDRGWHDKRYKTLIVRLKDAGLLHRTATHNKAPVVSGEGERLARLWLDAFNLRPALPRNNQGGG